MWVISLRNKAQAALIIGAALLLAALGWLTWRCAQEQYGRLLLAKSAAAPGLSPQQAEDFCRDEFLLTYEIERQTIAQAHNYRLPTTLIGTNSYYGQILGYRQLAGGFFSAAAFKAQNREAVLNRAAAFQLFGANEVIGQTLKLEGASWLIVGVLDDGDDQNPRVYVPASVSGGNIDSLLVLLDDKTVNADYAINGLKQLGVYDRNYTIVNLATAAAVFGQRLRVGLYTALILVLLLLLKKGAGRLNVSLPLYRAQLKQVYFRELLAAQGADLAKTAMLTIAMLGALAALIYLALQILAICLGWPGLLPPGHAWALGSFAGKLAWLHKWRLPGTALFALLLLMLALIMITGVGNRRREV